MKHVLVLLLVTIGPLLYAQKVTLQGKVTDAETGKPINNVGIYLTIEGLISYATDTDKFGNYKLDAKKGNYTLEIYHPEYEFTPISIELVTNEIKNLF
ncbi:carboxypeptidase-like regulatory domain-containing protein [Flavobacterium agricola]|uniref:Carboxypeptidase-like regulatory domain-containing protein n=1 Tax=Flavobacterium agricola TaxID=2870839 RepID=A0ABY6LYW5_9FLAO|nr:carboxypeptidase regulatory-like domain-containing protein [Flavobacterium agricola]UYW01519.1 carboxypeptidase-like regulatory domain-containing protein [Flavobacterium agricola]